MMDPENPQSMSPKVESMWTGKDVVQLTTGNFDSFIIRNPSVLVMFYAPCEYY